MKKSFGATDLKDTAAASPLRLQFFDGPLELNWAHCGATAEFLGDFNADIAETQKLDANDARHSIAYLTNELMENAVKFRASGDVNMSTSVNDTTFLLRLSNETASDTAARFATLLVELTSRDPGDLLIERIEANAENPEAGGSGLGILTLMNDYGARIGWTFDQEKSDANVHIETVAALTLS